MCVCVCVCVCINTYVLVCVCMCVFYRLKNKIVIETINISTRNLKTHFLCVFYEQYLKDKYNESVF